MAVEIANSFRSFLLNPPDYIITAGEDEKYQWSVHSKILAKYSGFFKTLLQSGFKETGEKKISLPDDDPIDIARMIIWMYYGKLAYYYDSRLWAGSGAREALAPDTAQMLKISYEDCVQLGLRSFHDSSAGLAEYTTNIEFSLYQLADKYDISSFKDLVVVAIEAALKKGTEDDMLVAYWRLSNFIKSSAISCRPLKALLEQSTKRHLPALCKDDRFREEVKGDPELAWSLLEEVVEDRELVRKEREKLQTQINESKARASTIAALRTFC